MKAGKITNYMLTSKTLIGFLKENSIQASPLDRLKILYRPLVCPFVELIGYVQPNDVVADIGCGSGQFCLLLSRFSQPKAIYGYEISGRLIENAMQLFNNKVRTPHHFEVFNGTDLPADIIEADVIFLIDVLHHIPPEARDAFIQQMYAKIKKGARVVIKDIDAASPFVVFNKLHDLVFSRQLVHENSLRQSEMALENAGFHILHREKKRMYVYPHYTILAEKQD
jgi:SAM-dependent methyltransferase